VVGPCSASASGFAGLWRARADDGDFTLREAELHLAPDDGPYLGAALHQLELGSGAAERARRARRQHQPEGHVELLGSSSLPLSLSATLGAPAERPIFARAGALRLFGDQAGFAKVEFALDLAQQFVADVAFVAKLYRPFALDLDHLPREVNEPAVEAGVNPVLRVAAFAQAGEAVPVVLFQVFVNPARVGRRGFPRAFQPHQ